MDGSADSDRRIILWSPKASGAPAEQRVPRGFRPASHQAATSRGLEGCPLLALQRLQELIESAVAGAGRVFHATGCRGR